MPLESCWLCDEELTLTKEHIIPESMGGKKIVRGFICRDCNSRTGHDWDVAVTNFESWKFQINSNLRINPQHGRPIRGRMADSGLNVLIDAELQMRVGFNAPVKKQGEASTEVYEFTSDPDRVDDLFESVNKLLQRRGKNPITRSEFDASIRRHVTPQPKVNLSLQLKEPEYFRSSVKTAMAMAFSLGINPRDCENTVRYLRDETMDNTGVVTMPGTSLKNYMNDWSDYHSVTILGLPDAEMLMGEVLYFGNVAGMIVLSNSYDGPFMAAGHVINLRTGEYVDVDLDLPNLLLPVEQLRERIKQFKSPLMFQILGGQNRMVA